MKLIFHWYNLNIPFIAVLQEACRFSGLPTAESQGGMLAGLRGESRGIRSNSTFVRMSHGTCLLCIPQCFILGQLWSKFKLNEVVVTQQVVKSFISCFLARLKVHISEFREFIKCVRIKKCAICSDLLLGRKPMILL